MTCSPAIMKRRRAGSRGSAKSRSVRGAISGRLYDPPSGGEGIASSAKQRFLDNYDREHERTVRVLRAYPTDKLDLKPHEMSKSARDLAWIFVLERGLLTRIWHDELVKGGPGGGMPPAPQNWDELLAAVETAHQDF